MSLRADIHAAIDQVSPPVPSLESKVRAFVRAEGEESLTAPYRGRWTSRVRWSASAVAAVMIVAIIVTATVGGRLWRDWNSYQNQQAIAELEARPLQLPMLQPGDACPAGPFTDMPAGEPLPTMIGRGPVYSVNGGGVDESTNWGTWTFGYFFVRRGTSGLILIRARNLVTNLPVVFNTHAPGFGIDSGAGVTTTGQVLVRDAASDRTIDGYGELIVDPSRLSSYGFADYLAWGVEVGFPGRVPGCVGYQIDGPGFTEVFVIGS